MSRKPAVHAFIFLFLICSFACISAEDIPLTAGIYFDAETVPQRTIKKGDFFRVMCEHELREEQGFDKPVLYNAINHEGGMKVRVLEVGPREEVTGNGGMWLHVSLTAPMWVDTGLWVPRGNQYWFWLPDDQQIFDYEG